MNTSSTLLDEALALGLDTGARVSITGRVVLVEDCVETSGAFVLHHLIKRALSNQEASGAVLLLALAQPFSHYDRVMRKLGCNLSAQRDNKRLHFFDMLKLECPGRIGGAVTEDGFLELFTGLQKALEVCCSSANGPVTIIIDDVSLLEIATHGSPDSVLDFLHYCISLTSEVNCSLVMLNHVDIYSSMESPRLLLHLEYLSDIVVKVEPLATGLSAEVHGQLTILNKGSINDCRPSRRKIHNFHFKVKENTVDYFYPGGQA